MVLPLFPSLKTAIPGPRSLALAEALRGSEAPNTIAWAPLGPVVWTRAEGMSVEDIDGNVLLDLTGGFGTALVGHGNPRVRAAAADEMTRCVHALGDVHAATARVALGKRLAALAPRPLDRVYFGVTGAEAVEIACETALLATGRPGVLAFTGAYHGLTAGTRALTDFPSLRTPLAPIARTRVVRLPFPDPRGDDAPARAEADLARIDATLAAPPPEVGPIGAVVIEPVQYRGGAVGCPTRVLRGLAEACRRHGALLVADEVATGCGRTGQWFACQGAGVVPDLLCIGKALGGGFPISACLGAAATFARWQPEPPGESLHTSTAMGHPVACVAALAVCDEIERGGLVARAGRLGQWWLEGLRKALGGHAAVAEVRGYGCLLGVECRSAALATRAAGAALRRGAIVLPEGVAGTVLVCTPPLTSTEAQATAAIRILREALDEAVAA